MDKIEKFLQKIDAVLEGRVRAVIVAILQNKFDGLDIKPLQGHKGVFRCRVGKVRVVFFKGDTKNSIVHIGFRGEVYKAL